MDEPAVAPPGESPAATPAPFRLIERLFVPICVAAGALGLALPGPEFLNAAIYPVLFAMMFLSCLSLPVGEIGRHLKRPWLLAWLVLFSMVLLPLAGYGVARLAFPAAAAAILILIAMPGGMMNSSLAGLCGGDAALALVGTGVTTLACPLTVPLLLWFAGIRPEHAGSAAAHFGRQALWLSLFVFIPPCLAALVRRAAPGTVARAVPSLRGVSVLLLSFLVYVGLSRCRAPLEAGKGAWLEGAKILAVLFVLSGVLHAAGYFLAFGRNVRERIALSVNVAYMNNMLGFVFALKFFGNRPEFILPLVLMEFPMHIWLAPLRAFGRRALGREAAGGGKIGTYYSF
ncbi:MAG: bile acid:sodium symporter [Planctomycetota bacterium]